MDDNSERQLTEKIKDCLVTVSGLLKEYKSLLQKQMQTDTTSDSDSDHSAETPLANAVTKRLKDIDLALESNQQQLKLALEQYLSIQPALSTSEDFSTIQSDANQMEVAKVTINQQVKLTDDGQNEAKLHTTVQALFTCTLPDDFYLHLISIMSIQDCLLSNRLVSRLWNRLVLDRCHIQKSLKLFESFNCLMYYGEILLNYEKRDDTSLILKSIGDDLLFEGLGIDHELLVNSLNPDVILAREKKREASRVLTALFPKIEQLVLITEDNTFINVEHLLQFYAQQLTSLTMNRFDGLYGNSGSKLGAFSFPKLKSLNTFGFSPEEEQLLFLLPQLESLTLGRPEISLETLLRTGTQLCELNIGRIQSVFTEPEEDFSKRPRIVTNLRKCSFGYLKNAPQVLEFISLNLTSLECLKLSFDCYRDNLHSLTSYLVPLQQLHSLTLEVSVSFFFPDPPQHAKIKPLPSVRHLKLIFSDYVSHSMDRFSRKLFKAFPKVEQVLIAFSGSLALDPSIFASSETPIAVFEATFAAFEAFADRHPNVVKLFRSKNLSRFTALPNAVSPLLGHHRQVYEEYIQEEELFGVAICKLSASLITRQSEGGPNLKMLLRAADRLSAMTNLLHLLESGAFTFLAFNTENNSFMLYRMIRCIVNCALKYGPSQVALFAVTCKCIISLLGCSAVEGHMVGSSYFKFMLQLVGNYKKQQFKDEALLQQMHHSMDKLIQEMLNTGKFEFVINRFIGENRLHRIERARALLRLCSRTKNCFRSN